MASANLFINCESEAEVHNKLMKSICCDYLDPESQKNKFQKFKLTSFLYLTSPVERCSSNPHDIWEELEKKGLLGLNNYAVLKKLVQDIDEELTYLIEDAEDKIELLKGEDLRDRKRQRTAKGEDTEIKEFREKLCKVNNYETQKVPVSPLQSTSKVPIDDIFVPVCIKEDLEYKGKGRRVGLRNKRTKPVKCPDDMFYIDDDIARNIFMLGDAGIGKSVFCLRLVENWCRAQKLSLEDTSSKDKEDSSRSWVYAMTKFDFLFFLQLRHVDKSRSSVIDMIVNEVFRTHPSCHDVIRRVLLSEKYRSIIVIDGVDEWKILDKVRSELKIKGLPNTENIVNCTFLWSMRPWIMEKFSDMIRGNDRVVEIQGLDSKDSIIKKMLVNFYELDEKSPLYKEKAEVIKEKSHEQSVKSIMKIPLMAIACIQIWYEGKDVGSSMTSLYIALLDLLIRRSKKKAPSPDELILYSRNKNVLYENLPQAFLKNESINEYMPIIMKLGRIAYDDLVSDNTNLVFRVEDLEKHLAKNDLNIVLEIGLLSKCEAPGSCNEENVSINFFHKSMQEFLAAIYIANFREMHEFYKHLSSLKDIMELGSVLIFLSWLNPMLGSRVSKHVVGIANVDENIIFLRDINDAYGFLNNSEIDLLFDLQVNCFREIAHTQSHFNIKHIIPYHVSDVFVSSDHEKEKHRATSDILTHHHADIRLLYLYEVPYYVGNGIPDSVLAQYLDHTRSLQSLYIRANNTNRTLHNISGVFSSLTNLILDSITIPTGAICSLQSALQSNTVIKNLGLLNIDCQDNEDQGSEPASLSGIIQILPDLPNLFTLRIDLPNEKDKPVFLDALNRLSHLFGIFYGGSNDEEYDCKVIQTLCTFTELYWISFAAPHIVDSGVKLSHAMSNLDLVMITATNMPPSGWRCFIQSVLAIKHELDVDLIDVNIDEKSRSMIRSSPELKITYSKENDDGLHDVSFSRIWSKQL